MSLPARIETARLILRLPERSDAQAIFGGWASDPDATKMMSWPRHRSIEDTRAFLDFAESEWGRWHAGPYLIALRETGEVIGGCGYSFVSAGVAQAGYILAPRHWGQGFATEAFAKQLEAARPLEPFRVTAAVHQDNAASLRVLAKCGFVPDDPPTTRSEFPNLDASAPQRALCFWRMAGRATDAGGASNQEAE